MIEDLRIDRPTNRSVQSWATGRHWPRPYMTLDGWRCHDCGVRLTRYRTMRLGVRRLRHHPKGLR